MKYLSDDGKIFNTEKECVEYERSIDKKIKLNEIKRIYQDLQTKLKIYSNECTEQERIDLLHVFKEVNESLGSR